MDNEKVFAMKLSNVYGCLVAKAERKGRTQEEVDALIHQLMGYDAAAIQEKLNRDVDYGSFFREAPAMHPKRFDIKGGICGIKLAEIDDPLMRDIRILDKLVDDLAKGKTLEKILMPLG